jgi:hypothetical protein
MEYLDTLMAEIKANPFIMKAINPDGKDTPYRLDQLKEQFRVIEYEKAAIENNAFKNQYSRELTDDEIVKNMEKSGRFDANEGLVFARQLEEIDPTRYAVIHKPLDNWKEVLPIKTFTPGTDRITYRTIDHTGLAELTAVGNITNVPRANAKGVEFSNKVYSWALGYGYTAQELRKAAMAGVPLSTEDLIAVELGYARRLQTQMFLGNSALGLEGFINATGVTNTQAPLGASGTDRTWPGGEKTNDEIMHDVVDSVSRVRTRTYGVYGKAGMTVALSQARFDFLANERMSSGTDTSIMQYILNNSAVNGISNFVVIFELSDQGTGSSQLMIVYPKDNRVLEANVVESIIWMPMSIKGLLFNFDSEMEFGGVTMRYAVALDQTYGI